MPLPCPENTGTFTCNFLGNEFFMVLKELSSESIFFDVGGRGSSP